MPRILSNETLDVRGSIDLVNATQFLLRDGAFTRAKLQQETGEAYVIHPTDARVWDDYASLLPGTAATDDLAVIEGTFGTDAPTIQTSDGKATTITQRLAFQFGLPPEYDAGETVTLRIRAGMITTVSDGTATVDVECYAHDDDGSVGSDLCTTAAQSINSLTKSNRDFVITPTSLTGGDVLQVRVTVAITDTATATAVIGEVSKIAMLLDIRG